MKIILIETTFNLNKINEIMNLTFQNLINTIGILNDLSL